MRYKDGVLHIVLPKIEKQLHGRCNGGINNNSNNNNNNNNNRRTPREFLYAGAGDSTGDVDPQIWNPSKEAYDFLGEMICPKTTMNYEETLSIFCFF